jgi:hypothetical protein
VPPHCCMAFSLLGAEMRARNGLEVIKPYLNSGGYELQALKLEDGQLHVQVRKYGASAGSALALRKLIENAILTPHQMLTRLRSMASSKNQPSRAGFIPPAITSTIGGTSPPPAELEMDWRRP